jgi:uncharacterized protein
MKLHLDRLSESPTAHRFAATAAWWREVAGERAPRGEGLAGDLQVDLRAHRMGADVYVDGEVTGALDLECGRCLSRYRHPVREGFRLVLEPAGDRVPADPDGAAALARDGIYLTDELEAGWFRGSEVDLRAFIQEVIALLFPPKPLCREDCLGLCPRCGVDRNVERCACEEARGASPFAALQRLRGSLPGGGDR